MHRRMGLFTLAMLLAAMAFALPAQAGDRAHDNGFFLRLSGGGGSASTDLEYGGSKLKLDGTTADLNVAIGAIVARNLALHGTLWGWAISNPDMTMDSFKVTPISRVSRSEKITDCSATDHSDSPGESEALARSPRLAASSSIRRHNCWRT